MVKARLPEPQTWVLKPEAAHRRVTCRLTQGKGHVRRPFPWKRSIRVAASHPNRVTRPSLMGQGRTRHLTAPHLLHCVNTGSPKRAALNGPAWRRSRHSSQKAWGNAQDSHGNVDGCGRNRPGDRSGDARQPGEGWRIQGTVTAMAAIGIADAYRCRGDGTDPRGCRSQMMRKYQVRFRGRGTGGPSRIAWPLPDKCDRWWGEVRVARSGPPSAAGTLPWACGSRGSGAACR